MKHQVKSRYKTIQCRICHLNLNITIHVGLSFNALNLLSIEMEICCTNIYVRVHRNALSSMKYDVLTFAGYKIILIDMTLLKSMTGDDSWIICNEL